MRHCEAQGRLGADGTAAAPQAVREAWRCGAAQAAAGTQWRRSELAASGFDGLLAIPVFSDSAVSEVVALYF